jgi:hypothetical protein
MPRPPPDPVVVDQAFELFEAGCSHSEIARALGVTSRTIGRWLTELKPTAAASAPAPEAPPPPPIAEMPAHMRSPEPPPFKPVDPSDTIGLIKQLIAEQHAQIHADKAAGLRGTPVSSAVATLEKLTKTLKQLEEAERKGGDAITVSAADYAAACADLESKVRAYAERGGVLRCADCNRALSIQWGLGSAPLDEGSE